MNNSGFDFLLDDEDKEGVLLLDLSQLSLAAATQEIDGNTIITLPMLRHVVLNSIRYNVLQAKKEGYTKVVIGVDNKEGGYWRRLFAYYYKLNRGKDREKSSFDWDAYFTAFNALVKEFELNMPYLIINNNHTEADDVIGVLTKYLALKGHRVKIVSSDGDFTQLHKFPGVIQWSPMQKKLVKSKSGSPLLDLMTKIIKGDRKDGVASIKVRSDYWHTKLEGERSPSVKASFIEEVLDAYTEGGVESLNKLLTTQELERFKENQVLIDFDFIQEDIAQNILTAYNEQKPASRKKMYSYFVKSKLTGLLSKINDF